VNVILNESSEDSDERTAWSIKAVIACRSRGGGRGGGDGGSDGDLGGQIL